MNRFCLFAFGIIVLLATTAPAQQPGGASDASNNGATDRTRTADGVPSASEQLTFLAAKLDLSPDQQAKIKPILQQLHDVTLKAVLDTSLTQEEHLTRVRPYRYKARDQIREILNDDQKNKLDQYLQGPHPEMHGNLTGTKSSPQPPQD